MEMDKDWKVSYLIKPGLEPKKKKSPKKTKVVYSSKLGTLIKVNGENTRKHDYGEPLKERDFPLKRYIKKFIKKYPIEDSADENDGFISDDDGEDIVNNHSTNVINNLDIDDEQEQPITDNNISSNEVDNISVAQNSMNDIEEKLDDKVCHIEEDGILIIPANGTVYLQGLVLFSVLEGCVEVNGYILKQGEEYKLYSPRGTSHLYLKNVWFQNKSKNASSSSNNLLNEAKEKYKTIKNDAICLCQTLNDKSINFIEKHISQKLFPTNNSRFSFKETLHSANSLVLSNDWIQMFKAVRLSNGNFEKILFCGGKGVGKSTLLRYGCNTFLKDYDSVLVIDVDPGQPEFTIPSCVSATIVKKPLFGPNYTHLQEPIFSYHLGVVNVSQNPTLYLECVKKLMESCKDINDMPILINCMGFTRGLGLELMISLLYIIQPHRVIEIYGSTQKNFAELLDFASVKPRDELFGYKHDSLAPYALFRVASMNTNTKGWELQPRQVREMSILSYFSQVVPEDTLSITDVNVPLFESSLDTIENFSDPNVVSAALGQLIAFCTLDKEIFKCFGFGILKGWDKINSRFAVITPINLEEYENAIYVRTGTVTLPPSLYMTEDNNSGMIPYIQPGNLSGFTQISKRSYISAKRPSNNL